ncbi:MAG TPA: sigma factor-like helix-turn-helix DNA-binding protein [Gemmataceae bacterium]|nr:sigma factor-like helix-turn-helix DNA-binding protein [Gemmataceae bacterium]
MSDGGGPGVRAAPPFDVERFWGQYQGLVYCWARRMARCFGGRPGDYWGYLTLRLLNSLYLYHRRPERPYRFEEFFARRIHFDVIRQVLRHESESWAMFAASLPFDSQEPDLLEAARGDRVGVEPLRADVTPRARGRHNGARDDFAELIALFDDPEVQLWHLACRELSPRERDMAERKYRLGHTLGQIAKDYGLTRERVRQVLLKAVDRIGKRLRPLWRGEAGSRGRPPAPRPAPVPSQAAGAAEVPRQQTQVKKPKRRRWPVEWQWRSVGGKLKQVFLRGRPDREADQPPQPVGTAAPASPESTSPEAPPAG